MRSASESATALTARDELQVALKLGPVWFVSGKHRGSRGPDMWKAENSS
jgi:hypothetical protein